MASLPTGAKIAVSTVAAAAKQVTGITNATEAMCSAAAHGLVPTDIIILNSGWGGLHGRVFRVKATPSADTFQLEGRSANTTSNKVFSPGGGAGSFIKVSGWVDIVQILGQNTSGGDAKKVTYRYMDSENELELNDGFTPTSRSLEIDADAIETPGYIALQELTALGSDAVQRVTTRNGGLSYLACTVAMNEEVNMTAGQLNRVKVDFSGKGRSTRYAS